LFALSLPKSALDSPFLLERKIRFLLIAVEQRVDPSIAFFVMPRTCPCFCFANSVEEGSTS
jgi:hypothetical protein